MENESLGKENFYDEHMEEMRDMLISRSRNVGITCPKCGYSWRERVAVLLEMLKAPAKLLAMLKEWRYKQAREEGCKLWKVFRTKELENIGSIMPQNPEEFKQIKGVGPRRFEKYTPEVLEIIRKFKNKKEEEMKAS
ncbi:HRDC domain-containing protein [Elusimicrobiota bacterium]